MKLHLLLPTLALSQASWRELSPENASAASAPAPRLGAVLASAGPGAGYALHGGCSSSCCYAPLSDLWLLTAAAQWVNVSAQLNAPTGRLYHGVTPAAAPGASYVYGGTDVQTGTLDELYLLTLDAGAPSAAWAPVRAPLPHPAPRSGHSQTALGAPAGAFLVLGGQDDDEGVLGDAWRFVPSPGASDEGTWSLVANFSAAGPGPRVQHSALALTLPWGAPALLLAAGTDAQGDDQDDVWLLDLGAAPAQWLLLGARPPAAPAAAWPSARHGHVAWGQQAAAPAGRGAAPGAAAATLSFYLFGGQDGPVPDPPKFLSDTWLFTVNVTQGAGGVALAGGQGAFSLVRPAAAPSARALAGVAATASATVLAGGFAGYNGGTDDRLLNDVWEVEGGAL